ncbi:MAG TPA: cupin-like domain-containing protein [Xanthobacteraceae bacterium]|jgi:hypothetical protein|nr:cupin-like domain-containing protein [Xanthobacteraceae bacterium]
MSTVRAAEAQAFETLFPLRPFEIEHDMANHPLFTLPMLARLVQEMPRDFVEYNSGKVAVNQDPNAVAEVALDPAEVVRQIETCGAWMVLKRVETHPSYRTLVEMALQSVARARGYSSLSEAGFYDIRGFLFVSSPHSTTPFHLDGEDNFFVHIHGDKTFAIYDNEDRSIASEEVIEQALTRHRNIPYQSSFDARSVAHQLAPGQGVFVPYQWPHWVRTGDKYAISMAVTWKTKDVQRRNDLFVVNAKLRSLGFPQRAPGVAPVWDSVKYTVFRTAKLLATPLQKSEAMRRLFRYLMLGKHGNYFYRSREKGA